MKKSISILGSTGSIGLSTLKIIDKKKNNFKIKILAANKNYTLIVKQIKKYKPKIFVVSNKFIFNKIKNKFKKKKIIILNNFNYQKFSKSDYTVSAIPGIAGLYPTIKLIGYTKNLLIANKESIICGWDILKKEAKKNNTKIIPIDSEHFSILRLLEKQKINEHVDWVQCVAFSPDGKRFASGSSDSTIKVFWLYPGDTPENMTNPVRNFLPPKKTEKYSSFFKRNYTKPHSP